MICKAADRTVIDKKVTGRLGLFLTSRLAHLGDGRANSGFEPGVYNRKKTGRVSH